MENIRILEPDFKYISTQKYQVLAMIFGWLRCRLTDIFVSMRGSWVVLSPHLLFFVSETQPWQSLVVSCIPVSGARCFENDRTGKRYCLGIQYAIEYPD